MLTHFYFINGITASNIKEILEKLERIDGAKPIQTEARSGISVFVAITPISHETITAEVLRALSGTNAVVFQQNVA